MLLFQQFPQKYNYKLLPIFQSIYLGVVQIKNNLPAYDKIEKELFESKKYSIDKKKVEGKKIELKNDEVRSAL